VEEWIDVLGDDKFIRCVLSEEHASLLEPLIRDSEF
jgi:hypothetical protein